MFLHSTPSSRFALAVMLLTLVIATSSPAAAAVHHVDCNNGPFVSVSDAVNNAPVNSGDTVIVHPCIYFDNILISGLSDVHLVAADHANAVGTMEVGIGKIGFSSPVVIDGSFSFGVPPLSCLMIESSTRITVTGFEFRGCDGEGILVESSTDVRIHANRIEQAQNGMVITQSKRPTVTGNVIFNNAGDGIALDATDIGWIADNIVQENDRGIKISSGGRNVFINNLVHDHPQDGITDGGSSTWLLRNNSTSNAWGGGLANVVIDSSATAIPHVIGNWVNGSIINLSSGPTEQHENW